MVNDQEVSREEFQWFMEQERAGVVAQFKVQHNLEYGPDYWSQVVGGSTPKAVLQKQTIERLTAEKVEQILFQQLGLVQDIRYAAFLEQLETFNRERAQAAKLGKVVYGPLRFTQLQFYGHRKATLRAQAAEKLAQTQWRATEENLKQFYDDNRALFRAPASSTLEVVTVQPSQNPAAGQRTDAVQATARKILAQVNAGESLPELLQGPSWNADVQVSRQRLEDINGDRLGELFSDETQLKTVLALAPGEAALLSDSETQARVVRCLGKAAAQVRPYAAVRQQAQVRWLDQQYERHIKTLASQAQVRINQEAIDALFR